MYLIDHKQVLYKAETYRFYSKRDLEKDILKVKCEEMKEKELIVLSPNELGICDGIKAEEKKDNIPVIIVEP